MNKHRKILVCLAALLLALPLSGLANTVYLQEYDLLVRFPANVDVLARNMAADSPVLALYGKSAEQVTRELEGAGLYAKALDIAGEYELSLAARSSSKPLFDELDENALNELASKYGGSQYELLSLRQGSALLVFIEGGRSLVCLARANGLEVELRLQANRQINNRMAQAVKGIVGGFDLSFGQ